ncbi:Uncharacterised protein [Mycobacteroides abscessus]|nr:Uncharacterised protein [Mycobacteroides abscessus]
MVEPAELGEVGDERRPVEVPDDVVHRRTRGVGVVADGVGAEQQDPPRVVGVTVQGQLDQVGALPNDAGRAQGPEGAQVLPGHQVVGGVEQDLPIVRLDGEHDPPGGVAVVVADHLGVAKGGGASVEDRVPGIGPPREAAVVAGRA